LTRDTIEVSRRGPVYAVKLNRPEHHNGITQLMLRELDDAITEAEADASCRLFELQGNAGVFCAGMDLAASLGVDDETMCDMAQGYASVLTRLAGTRLIVMARIEGRVLAGGVGLAAASDLVLATHTAQFCLTELIWGILPACVLPWLMRRTGFQPAYAMTLTAETLSAEQAKQIGLVDFVDDDLERVVRRLSARLLRVESTTVARLKHYCRTLWIVDAGTERRAVAESARAMVDPKVRRGIAEFIAHQRYPWELRRDADVEQDA
jgi:polyketide biosynthesis enoyl-CoA hydratase PksH